MHIDVEVVCAGNEAASGYRRSKRGPDVAADEGIGLVLDEIKSFLQRLQEIVANEQAREVVEALTSCGKCGHELPTKTAASMDAPREHVTHVLELDAEYVRAVSDKCDGRNSFDIIASRLVKPRGRPGGTPS